MDATLIPQFGGFLWTVLAFVAALSIIVAIHEYGHYIVGRWCGIKADVFSIGFGPILWSRDDRHGTRWQVAALPLGGYVKFRGDGNAASVGEDNEATAKMTAEELSQTMTGASLWRRSATVAAGPAFNFILSILIFGAFALFLGRAADAPVIGELRPLPETVVTLQPGDEVVSVAGTDVSDLAEIAEVAEDVPPAPTIRYEVIRDGETVRVDAAFPLPARADSVMPRGAAWDIGMRPDDVILAVDDAPIYSFRELREIVEATEGRPLVLDVWRPGPEGGEELTFTLTPRAQDLPRSEGGFERRWIIGINGGLFFEPATEETGLFGALAHGVDRTFYIIQSSLSALGHIVTGAISTCNLSGPVGIAKTAGAVASTGILDFVSFIAVLSAAVGMLNLFPIPVLDGGHLVFHAYEAVRGRPPSDEWVRALMVVGVALMLTLMVFATWNDFVC
ncbi:Regulator of sigma E protease [Jannaschia seosinensis]|uniref:Zinc metalloprotease n=1 Tax=Jannaschia seosinensis TaxID=313367 RepID=A0A0M7BGQ3_9RHOB|nr:RIP metalloprotease RseP [Jannaschia seosinensis]CUH41034.1 Regulator of sigma E protease [Jannaschia seosinensis]